MSTKGKETGTRFFGFRPRTEKFNEYVESINIRKAKGEVSQNASIGGELEILMVRETERVKKEL